MTRGELVALFDTRNEAAARVNLAATLAALVTELERWDQELGRDITRAEQRRLPTFAADLRALREQVQRVHSARWILKGLLPKA